ncbi:hypothetical protein BDGGKGIB_02759 [Nodularia sphaerocarpa UHCC 0038]|nr:hypothetical protein BDGGKGIB_02759 [Nodularia sphaerocarpa UHCC 0038]
MATITDDIGIWNDLGTVRAERREWHKLPNTSVGGNPTIRISFICSDWEALSSYILIRPLYKTANSEQVGQATRIFPRPIPEIVEIPIPNDLLARFINFRDFEVYKVGRRLRTVGITPDANLDVRGEELWG